MYFKEGIKAILKTKFFSLVIVIQLVIAFLALIAGITLAYGAFEQVHRFEKVFDPKTTLYITYKAVSMDNIDSTDEKGETTLLNYYTGLINDKNVSKIGTNFQSGVISDDLYDLSDISSSKETGNINSINIDENFYKYIDNMKVIKGRKFEKEDFGEKQKDVIPIIISSDLEKYMPLEKVYKERYRVIGVLDDKQMLFYDDADRHSLYSEVKQEKNTVIFPVNYKDKANLNDISHSIMNDTMVTLKDESLCDKYIQKIKSDLGRISKVPLKVSKISDYKDDYIKLNKTGIIATLGLAAVLIVFSFFGIMGIILSSIIRRKKEFGVKLSFGWSIRDISLQVVSEILILSISSFIIAGLLSLVLVRGENIELNLYIYLISLVLVLIFASLYALIPVYKIRKMKIVDLIKDVR